MRSFADLITQVQKMDNGHAVEEFGKAFVPKKIRLGLGKYLAKAGIVPLTKAQLKRRSEAMKKLEEQKMKQQVKQDGASLQDLINEKIKNGR